MVKKMIEGSRGVAEAVALCRPQVIAAYPITPQTHIVQELAQIVADGDLAAQYINVESEHSAASVVLGSSATGVRVYTTTTSQGLLLMEEVLYNIAGMRLPVVLACANRAVSSPLNIWNDQQDSMALRDSGVIQLYAENNQEAADFHLLAYRVAEDRRLLLPVMVCLDGFILTHAHEMVDLPTQEQADAFLPPYNPPYILDPDRPLTLGAFAEPDKYTETRYMIQQALDRVPGVLAEAGRHFERIIGRPYGQLLEKYRLEDAETVLVGMGSMMTIVKDVVDELRAKGQRVGAARLILYRPFPKEAVIQTLGKARHVLVLEKAVSLGSGGPLATEIRALFQGRTAAPAISGGVLGLGGRDISPDTIKEAVARAQKETYDFQFLDVRQDVEWEEVG